MTTPPNEAPVLLSGGNPQIPEGDGDEPVAAYLAAMPGWKHGAALHPPPPVSAKDPDTRYLRIHDDLIFDEDQLRDWIRQASAIPGWHGF